MTQYGLFLQIFFANLAMSMIGPFTVLGPMLGFPLILIYSIGISFLGVKSTIKNILYSILGIIIILITLYKGFPMLLIGIIFHSVGIIAGIFVSSFLVAKYNTKSEK